MAGAVVIATGFLYTLTITCFGCPNSPIELCTCVTNGLMTRNMFLIIGAFILALGGGLHLLEIRKSKRVVVKMNRKSNERLEACCQNSFSYVSESAWYVVSNCTFARSLSPIGAIYAEQN